MISKKGLRHTVLILVLFMLTFLPFSTEDLTFLEATSSDEQDVSTSQTAKANMNKHKQPLEEIDLSGKDRDDLYEELGIDKVSRYATIEEKIDAILQTEELAGTIPGISIRHAETGELLYSHDGDRQVRPASNMKIITSVAALEVLGPDYQFSTEVLTDGEIVESTLEGNLYLKGKGDPTLLKEDLDQFAAALKEQGIDEITGDIIGDDSWFDDVRLSEDMSWDNEPSYVAAQISALTLSPDDDYDTGSIIVEVYPGTDVGEPARVKTIPETDVVTIVNDSNTVASGEGKNISVEREHGSNQIVIEGQIPVDGSISRVWSSVWEPTEYVLDVFKKSLEEQDISMNDDATIERGLTPDEADVLKSKQSMPLEDILIPFMKLSNNGHAEILTKEMGRSVYGEGSWTNGIQVLNDIMSKFDLDGESILLRDGSGMSDKTLIPADELSHLLYAIQDREWFPIFENALPVAGESDRLVGGTLRNRMTGESTKGNVKAKTGSLTSVSTLSGYVTTQDGEKLIFSMLMNNFISGSMTTVQDTIATELAEHEFKK